MSELKKTYPKIPLLALTATASLTSMKHLIALLRMNNPKVVYDSELAY